MHLLALDLSLALYSGYIIMISFVFVGVLSSTKPCQNVITQLYDRKTQSEITQKETFSWKNVCLEYDS